MLSAVDRSPTIRSLPGKPASRPFVLVPGTILPPEYFVLQTRSIFCPSSVSVASPVGPDAGFVFKGAIQVGQGFTAFVEDLVGNRVIELAAGDTISRGRIKSIDIDSIEYVVAANTRRVTVGQTLEAVDFQVKPTSQPAAAGAPSPGAVGDGKGGAPAAHISAHKKKPGHGGDAATDGPPPKNGPDGSDPS